MTVQDKLVIAQDLLGTLFRFEIINITEYSHLEAHYYHDLFFNLV